MSKVDDEAKEQSLYAGDDYDRSHRHHPEKAYTRPLSLLSRSQDYIFRRLDHWNPHPWTPIQYIVESRVLQFPQSESVESYVKHIHTTIGCLLYKLCAQPLFGPVQESNNQARYIQECKVEEWIPVFEVQDDHASRPLSHMDLRYIFMSMGLVSPSEKDYVVMSSIDRLWNKIVPSSKEQNRVRVETLIEHTSIFPVQRVYGQDVWTEFMRAVKNHHWGDRVKEWVHYRLVLWVARLSDKPVSASTPLYTLFKPDPFILDSTHKTSLCSGALIEEYSNMYRERTDWISKPQDILKIQQMFEDIVGQLRQIFPSMHETLDGMRLLVGGTERWSWNLHTSGLPVLQAMMLSHQERLRRTLSAIGQMCRRDEWRHAGFFEVNAYYIRELNVVYIPMAWFTIEGFWPRVTKSFVRLWAGMGAVLAHECAHAVDNEGVRVRQPLQVRLGAPDPSWLIRWKEYLKHHEPHSQTETEDGCDIIAMDVVTNIIGTFLPPEIEDEFQTHYASLRQPFTYDDPVIRETYRSWMPVRPTVHRSVFVSSLYDDPLSHENLSLRKRSHPKNGVHSDDIVRVARSLKWRTEKIKSSLGIKRVE